MFCECSISESGLDVVFEFFSWDQCFGLVVSVVVLISGYNDSTWMGVVKPDRVVGFWYGYSRCCVSRGR